MRLSGGSTRRRAALLRADAADAARHTLNAFVALAGDNPGYRITRLRAEAVFLSPAEAQPLIAEARSLAAQLQLPVELRELQ
jgi:hypothetical protein